MRVGLVRTDLNKIYLADLENRSQRCFSSEPPGQSRYLAYPSNSALEAALNTYAFLTVACTDNNATVNTTAPANVLSIRTNSTAAYTNITVTSNAALSKTVLVTELNAGFAANGLPLVARLQAGQNRVRIDTTGSNSGPNAYVQLNINATSTLNAVIGAPAGAVSPSFLTGLSVANLSSAVYPAPNTINVSSANILGLSTFANLTTTAQNALVDAIADVVAPSIVETGPALLSFVYGNLSKFSSLTFQPGGTRVGLPVGPAVAVLEDDGSTPFSV
jgi:hypothetical protein